MAASLTLSLLEIILLMFGAVILGITIHFFLASRKSLNATTEEMMYSSKSKDEWKLRYFDEIENRDKELAAVRSELKEAKENADIFSIEAEELRLANHRLQTELKSAPKTEAPEIGQYQKEILQLRNQLRASEENNNLYAAELKELRTENKKLAEQDNQHVPQPADNSDDLNSIKAELESLRQQAHTLTEERDALRKANRRLENEVEVLQDTAEAVPARGGAPDDYLEQLQSAKQSLIEQNHKINQLLGNIDVIREKEEMQREILRTNEELAHQVDHMRIQLTEKEREIENVKQQQLLANEMTSMLDSAYNEFNVLQDKISKLETQLSSSKMVNIEFEDLREEHSKLARDYEFQKSRSNALDMQCKQLQEELLDKEDKLKETSFQKQQLQKKVAYLEELNHDMQLVAEANKKLELQLRRVGELESRLNVVSAERDKLLHQGRD